MASSVARDPQFAIVRSSESLSLEERIALAGKTVALELYTPETLPLQVIEAIGDSVDDCIRQLISRKLDPQRFEFTRLKPPY